MTKINPLYIAASQARLKALIELSAPRDWKDITGDEYDAVSAALQQDIQATKNAPLYCWHPETLNLALIAASRLPLTASAQPHNFKSQTGFHWLGQHPRLLLNRDDTTPRVHLAAISYYWLETSLYITAYAIQPAHCGHTEHRALGVLSACNIESGDPLSTVLDDLASDVEDQASYRTPLLDTIIDPFAESIKLLLGANLWLQQKIIDIQTTYLPTKQQRENTASGVKNNPVSMITLRQKNYEPTENTRSVDWSCRWIVGALDGGHWHTYHTANGTEIKWLMPYTKGPADKPLKLPGQKFFNISR